MRRLIAILGSIAVIAVGATPVFGAVNPAGTGQPGQSCEQQTSGPAGFNTAGFAHAQTVYANVDGTHMVSQYDVACYQVSLHH
jgi:hypothetical protein